MYNVSVLNNIAQQGLDVLASPEFALQNDATRQVSAIILRSHDLKIEDIGENIEAVSRAGVGVNNIPVHELTQRGVPVLNTPGANANAVKELVIAAMLLASRHILKASQFVRQWQGDNQQQLSQEVEQHKKKYVGSELPGKKIGIIGLGAIGVKVANAAIALGMEVVGFDPHVTIENSWQLSPAVKRCQHIESLLKQVDYLSFHVPLNDATRHMLNADLLALCKSTIIILNFSRSEIISEHDMLCFLKQNMTAQYVSDFPSVLFAKLNNVISLPHLGASTNESQTNCAVMAARQLKKYLLYGEIINAVNFPVVQLEPQQTDRLTIANVNQPSMVSQISSIIASYNVNILSLVNKSREDMAYTVIDISDSTSSQDIRKKISSIEGVLRVRLLPAIKDDQ